MKRVRTEQRGWVLVTAMIVMALMLTAGLGIYGYTDQQQRESGQERVREAAFNLAEGVLTAQLYTLSRQWPGSAGEAYPYPACTQASTDPKCPSAAKLSARFNSVDFSGTNNRQWSTLVIDDGTTTVNGSPVSLASFYDDTAALQLASQGATWDQNDNGQVWVRSSGTARGKLRIIVARVKIEFAAVNFPNNVITAGRIRVITNGSGNGGTNTCPGMAANSQPPIVCTARDDGTATPIHVRCESPTYSSVTKTADDWQVGGNHCLSWAAGQVAPIGQVDCGPGHNPSPPGCTVYDDGGSAISSEALDALRDTALSTNTYCNADGSSNPAFCDTGGASIGCPKKAQLIAMTTGKTVFIEQTPSAGCAYQGNGNEQIFPASDPGRIIIASGAAVCSTSSPAFDISGSMIVNGVVYSANLQGWSNAPSACPGTPSPANISVRGNARIVGAVALDADGLVELNANANNVRYSAQAIDNFKAFGTAGIIQNTWRELK